MSRPPSMQDPDELLWQHDIRLEMRPDGLWLVGVGVQLAVPDLAAARAALQLLVPATPQGSWVVLQPGRA